MTNHNLPISLQHWTKVARQRVLSNLDQVLPDSDSKSKRFHQAMQYVMQHEGKRLRPMLVYLTNDMLHGNVESADASALAVELIHSYSLVHDDLPAMDNDDIRRGKPSCHRAFDEATAILVGDALQTLAFEVLSKPSNLNPINQLNMISILAKASGPLGMCGGQALDIQATLHKISLEDLKHIHQMKTGALIKASILLGAYASQNATDIILETLHHYADCIGLAFQVQDDILDIVSSTEVLGKPQGSDQNQGKMTYPSLMGFDKACRFAKDLCEQGKTYLQALSEFNSSPLCNLADYINQRVA